MRTWLIVLAVVGCGDNAENGVIDMSVAIKRDLSALNTSCDVAMQDCTGGKKCVGMFDGQDWVGTCVTAGTVAAGQPCQTQQSSDTLLDNCQGGLICDNIFGSQDNLCRKICAKDGDCGANEKCGDFLFAGVGWGWCTSFCTPFSTAAGNCPANMDCGETVDSAEQPDPNAETGFFLCKKTGAGGPYAVCMGDSDCGANLWCGYIDSSRTVAECIPNCSDTVMCEAPNADAGVATGVQCHPLATQPDNAGYCYPQ
jgi:hypothetical protein